MSQQSQKNTPKRILDTAMPLPGRSWFNRGYVSNWTGLPGRAVPVFCKHVPANTKVKLAIKSKFESFPSLTPLKSNYIMDFQAYFCPTRLYVPELRTNNVESIGYFEGDEDRSISGVKYPVLNFVPDNQTDLASYVLSIGGVLNRLGLPVYDFWTRGNYLTYNYLLDSERDAEPSMSAGTHNVPRKNAIPYLAYLDIWARNYANVNEPDVPVDAYSVYGVESDFNADNLRIGYSPMTIKLADIQKFISGIGFNGTFPTGFVGYSPGSKTINVAKLGFQATAATGGTTTYKPLVVNTGVDVAVGGSAIGMASITPKVLKYVANTSIPQGLMPVTYMPDYFTTWINSDAYDRANVSLDATSLSVSTIRIAQRKFMSLAKQIFSNRTYTDWNYTQYGASLKLCDYPIFVGKDRVVFNFDTLRSQSQTGTGANEYLGAGVGIAKSGQVAKPIKFETEEDGYLMVIASLVPEVNYYLGSDKFWDYLGMEDLPLPAYDAVGFQDLLRGEFCTHWDDRDNESVGKVPYAYELMSSVNRSQGLMQTRAFRSWVNNREEYDPTTYVDPARYNYNFVQIGQHEDNFVIDTLFSFSAKQPFSKQMLNFNR